MGSAISAPGLSVSGAVRRETELSYTDCPSCQFAEMSRWERFWERFFPTDSFSYFGRSMTSFTMALTGQTWAERHTLKFIETGDMAEYHRMLRHIAS